MSDISAKDNQCGIDLSRPPSTQNSAISVVDVPICIASALTLQGFGRPVTDFSTEPLEIVPFPLPPGSWRSLVDGTGVEGGYVEDVFENQRIGNVQYSVNVGLKRKYVIGWYGHDPLEAALGTSVPILSPTSILTHEAREADFRVMEGKVLRAALQRARAAKHERKANYHPDGGQIICSRDGVTPFVLLLAPPGDTISPASFKAFYIDPTTNIKGVHINAGTWHQPAFTITGEGVLENRQGRVHGCVSASFVSEFNAYLRVPLRV